MSYMDFIDPLGMMHDKNKSPEAQTATTAKIEDPGTSYLLTDKEKQYYSELENLLYGSVQGTQKAINNGNINREKYFHDLYDPAKNELTTAYNKDLGQTSLNSNTLGTSGSLGFENYRANQLDKNYTDSVSNLESQARINSYDLPNTLMKPYTTAGEYAGNELTNTRNRKYTEFMPAYQRANMLTNGNVLNAGMTNKVNMNNYNQAMAAYIDEERGDQYNTKTRPNKRTINCS